jgi:hypothetical protein
MVFSLPKSPAQFEAPTSAETPPHLRTVITDQAAADLREAARLEALERYEVLDSPKEEAFDRITRLAKKVLDVPLVMVAFVDNHRTWTKASDGLEIPEVRRCHSFCSRTVLQSSVLVVPDARLDPRFATNPYVAGEPHVRFYAGVPLMTPDGFNLGSLCAVDMVPRDFSGSQIEMLEDLGKLVMSELELRKLASRPWTRASGMCARAILSAVSAAKSLRSFFRTPPLKKRARSPKNCAPRLRQLTCSASVSRQVSAWRRCPIIAPIWKVS